MTTIALDYYLCDAADSAGAADHDRWRRFMAERVAQSMDMRFFGVRSIHLCGSAETGQAGVGSDIDLIIHFAGTAETRSLLEQ